ncbi:hypothetical protein D3C75_1201780 [compost metagenome]
MIGLTKRLEKTLESRIARTIPSKENKIMLFLNLIIASLYISFFILRWNTPIIVPSTALMGLYTANSVPLCDSPT